MSVQMGYAPLANYGPGLQLGRVRRASGAQQQWGRYRLGGPFSFRGDLEGATYLKRTFDRQPELYFKIDEPGAALNSFTLVDSMNNVLGPYPINASLSYSFVSDLLPGLYRVVMQGVNEAGDGVSITDRLRIVTRIAKLYRDGSSKMRRDGTGKLWRGIV